MGRNLLSSLEGVRVMYSSQQLKALIFRKNLLIAVVVTILFIVIFFVWMFWFITKDSAQSFNTVDDSFKKLISSVSENLILSERTIEDHINSNLPLAKQILESNNYIESLEQVEKIYETNLPERYVDIDIILSDKEGNIISSTGFYTNYQKLHFTPITNSDIDTYPKFISFVPGTRRLIVYSWINLKDKYLVFGFYVNPKVYIDIIEAFTNSKLGNIREIAIYISAKERWDSNLKSPDRFISAGIQNEKVVRTFLNMTFYKEYILHRYDSLITPVYLRVSLNYMNYLYISLVFVLIFMVTVFIFTYLSSKYSIEPFEKDLATLNAAVSEIGNRGVLPPAGDFRIAEAQQFYETLSAMLQELSATMEELEATNEELEKAYNDIANKSDEFKSLLLNISERLAIIAEGYDEDTGQHIFRVKLLSGFLAEKLGLEEERVEQIKMFASLHDIGKIFVPKEILQKPGKLTSEEWDIMRQHTIFAKRILDVPGFESALNIALYHHENYDGTGYPFGLKGKEIPIDAHIVKLVDIYDALRSSRPYKKGFSHEEAMKIILEGDGRTSPQHFSPELLRIFEKYADEIKRLWDSIK